MVSEGSLVNNGAFGIARCQKFRISWTKAEDDPEDGAIDPGCLYVAQCSPKKYIYPLVI